MITVALFNKTRKIKDVLNNNPEASWCYIGKDVTKRDKITRALGEERRFYLKDRLHKIAEELRQPYLDFVAEVGKGQKDQLNWWASRFASKNPFQTDFFLLLCYKVLVTELIKERNDNDKLIIFIEDPWLFIDIKNINHNKNIQFLGCSKIFLNGFFSLTRGITHRLLLIGWFVIAKSLIYYYHGGKKPKILETRNTAVGILNPAVRRASENGQYADDFMFGLSDFYNENGIPFFYLYLYLLRFPLSAAKYVRTNRETLWPLVIDIRFSSLVRRIFEHWNPILSDKISKEIKKSNISILLQRERWFEFSSVGFNINLILFDTLNNFFGKKWCRSLICLFENQPWEKMLCMAALKNNVRVIGYQHSSIWKLFLSQFIGNGENLFMPLPYKIVTAGNYFAELYKEGGMPEDKIVVGGAWRYLYLLNEVKNNAFVKKEGNSKLLILVSLSLDIFISKAMLESIFKIVSNNQLENKMQFWIKFHPGLEISNLNIGNKLSSKFRIVNKQFNELLKEVDIVISSRSTTGLESFLYGKKVICYIPENLLAADPLLDISDERIYKWYEGEDVNLNFLKELTSVSNPDDMEKMKRKYFDKINGEVWLKFITI